MWCNCCTLSLCNCTAAALHIEQSQPIWALTGIFWGCSWVSLDLVDQSCSGQSHECSIGEASGSCLEGCFFLLCGWGVCWKTLLPMGSAITPKGCAWYMPEEQPQTPCRLLHFNQMVTLPQWFQCCGELVHFQWVRWLSLWIEKGDKNTIRAKFITWIDCNY